MSKATYGPAAERDLLQIAGYISLDSPAAALAWLDRIRGVCDLLATKPEMGQMIRTKRFGGIRRHSVGNYVIYYRPVAEGIVVLRIVHGARDQDRLL